MEKIKFDFDVPQDPYVEVYDPDGELVIRTNDDKVFLKICCQIKDAKAEGYYVVNLDEMGKIRERNPQAEVIKHPITSYGRVRLNGSMMFHVYGELLRHIFC